MANMLVVFDRYVDAGGVKLRIGGLTTRNVAHFHGVPHGSVQVAVVFPLGGESRILLHKRSPWKHVSPSAWDVLGGHVEAEPTLLSLPAEKWSDQQFIAEMFAETAVREANEELRVAESALPGFEFRPAMVRCFGGLCVFETGFDTPNADNREHSAFFAAWVPEHLSVLAQEKGIGEVVEVVDTIGVGGVQQEDVALELRLATVAELTKEYRSCSTDFADGIGRILARLTREPETLTALARFLGS